MLGRVLSFPFEMQTHKAERVVAFFFEVQSRKTSFMDANEGRILAQLWFPLKVCRYHIEGQLLSQKYYNVYGIFPHCYKENKLVHIEVESIIKTGSC